MMRTLESSPISSQASGERTMGERTMGEDLRPLTRGTGGGPPSADRRQEKPPRTTGPPHRDAARRPDPGQPSTAAGAVTRRLLGELSSLGDLHG